MGNLRLTRIDADQVPDLESFADRTLFQTAPWLRFIALTQNAEPVLARLTDDDQTVGWFTGLTTRKYGLPVLGSPFPGWTTAYMGFNLLPHISRPAVLPALETFAFRELDCLHFELMDRRLTFADIAPAAYAHSSHHGFEVDLRPPRADLLAAMTPACRRNIRKAEREGLRAEASVEAGFVNEYYSQLEGVFARQRLAPTYPRSRVRALLENLLPGGNLLLVRVRTRSGETIASGIFPAQFGSMYFWGGASRPEAQILRPNELLHWFAMCYWKERGMTRYDMGGGGEYKRKYGGREIAVPWIRRSRYPGLGMLRQTARGLFRFRQRLSGLLRR